MFRLVFLLVLSTCFANSLHSQEVKSMQPNWAIKLPLDTLQARFDFYQAQHRDSASLYAFAFLKVAQTQKNELLMIQAYQNLATFMEITGKNEEAILYSQKGLEKLANLKGQEKKIIAFYCLLSIAYTKQVLPKQAIKYAYEGHNLAKKIKDPASIAETAEIIGNIYYFTLKDYDKAIAFYTITADYLLNYDFKKAAGVSSNIGNNYYQKKDYDQALKYYRQSFRIAKMTNDAQGMGYSSDNMGLAYRRKKDFQKAYYYFYEGYQYRKVNNNIYEVINSLNHLALIEAQLNNYAKAEDYAKENLQLSQTTKNYDLIAEALETLSKITEQQSKWAVALKWQKQLLAAKDCLAIQQNTVQLHQLAANHDFMQQIKENELLKKDNKLQEEIVNAQKRTIWVITLTGFAISFLLLFMWYAKQRETQAKQNLLRKNLEIEQKNGQIEKTTQLLSEQNQELAQLTEVQNKLFNIIGHDLKNPIDNLSGLLDLTVSKDISQEDFWILAADLKKSTSNVKKLLDNLLLWSQAQKKGNVLDIKELNLYEMVEEKQQLFSLQLSQKQITLLNQVPPKLKVWADANHLRFILRNLLANAIKFTHPQGTVTIKAKNLANEVEITITDTGVGMSAKQIENILYFSKNISTKGTQGEKGTGLGLLFCKDFIELNGGKLAITSELNKGTTFLITLPSI